MTTTIQVMSAGKRAHSLNLKAQTIMIGSLMSNQIALSEPGVEPIHAMLERNEDGDWRLTDLGTLAGVRLNGERVVIEATVKAGDLIEIGGAKLKVAAWKEPVRRVVPTLFGTRAHKSELREGRLLEVVAYWGNTVLNVDHFSPDLKGYDEVTIGDPTKAHFISGGKEFFDSRVLADVEEASCTLKLAEDMQANVRKDGAMQKLDGVKRLQLGPRDYAHVQNGAVRYFLHYANHPKVELPVNKSADKILQGLSAVGLLAYFAMVMVALLVKPRPIEIPLDVYDPVAPNDPRRTRLITLEEFTPTVKKVPVKEPDKVKPVKPTQVMKKPTKVTVKPITTAAVKPVVSPAVKPVVAPTVKPAGSGAPAGQAQPVKAIGNSGGPGTKPLAMGQLKGATKFDKPGVEGGTTSAPSTMNLGKLGNQFGKVSALAGGTHVDFKDSAGGNGMKLGSGTKDLGMGGPGNGHSLDIAGVNGKLGSWGKGPGGMIGKGGDGPGGAGIGPGFGNHSQASVEPAAPMFIGEPSINTEEILRVVRAHLNEIRHCYEQTLQRAPNTFGRVKVLFTIGADGRIVSTTIADSSIPDVIFRACLTGKISRWAFPRLPTGAKPVQVGYPFIFQPQAP